MDPTAEPAPLADVTNLRSQMYHGDCFELMPTLPAGEISLVFADLPYSVTAFKWDASQNLAVFWDRVSFIQDAKGVVALTAVQPLTTDLIVSNRRFFRYDLVWQKSRQTNFFQAKRRPMRQHESILIFARAKHIYNPQKVFGRIRRDKNNRKQSGFHPNLSFYQHDGTGLKHPSTILRVCEAETTNSSLKRFHPTQKPVALLEWLIKSYSNPGDTILDPCSGSATTAIAALRTGRHSICIEKDKGYYDIGVKRVAEERARLGLEPM